MGSLRSLKRDKQDQTVINGITRCYSCAHESVSICLCPRHHHAEAFFTKGHNCKCWKSKGPNDLFEYGLR